MHGVAVIAEDRTYKVFSDIVDVAVDRCDHYVAFVCAIGFLEELLSVCNRALHDTSRFEYERENQLT